MAAAPFAVFLVHSASLRRLVAVRSAGSTSRALGPVVGVPFPCAVQADGRPSRAEAQGRRAGTLAVRIFVEATAPAVAAGDVLEVGGVAHLCEGPAYDDGGMGALFAAPLCIDATRGPD